MRDSDNGYAAYAAEPIKYQARSNPCVCERMIEG